MKSLRISGWLAIVFGVLILLFPNLLNNLVAIFFLFTGVNILLANRWFRG